MHVVHVKKFVFGNYGHLVSISGRIGKGKSVDAKLCPGRLRNCLVIPERTTNRGVSGRCVHDDLVGPRDTGEICVHRVTWNLATVSFTNSVPGGACFFACHSPQKFTWLMIERW